MVNLLDNIPTNWTGINDDSHRTYRLKIKLNLNLQL